MNDPAARNVDFDQLRAAYYEQAEGLLEGGVDLFLVETIFDTLNAKAALFALDEYFETAGERLPLVISGTVTDASGRILSGQTVTAFWHSVRHARPLAVGLNCALGAALMRPYIQELARVAGDTFVSCYPERRPAQPDERDRLRRDARGHRRGCCASSRPKVLVNIVGGCCGYDAHIVAIRDAVGPLPARSVRREFFYRKRRRSCVRCGSRRRF